MPGVVLGELIAAGAPDPLEARQLMAAPALHAQQQFSLPNTGQGSVNKGCDWQRPFGAPSAAIPTTKQGSIQHHATKPHAAPLSEPHWTLLVGSSAGACVGPRTRVGLRSWVQIKEPRLLAEALLLGAVLKAGELEVHLADAAALVVCAQRVQLAPAALHLAHAHQLVRPLNTAAIPTLFRKAAVYLMVLLLAPKARLARMCIMRVARAGNTGTRVQTSNLCLPLAWHTSVAAKKLFAHIISHILHQSLSHRRPSSSWTNKSKGPAWQRRRLLGASRRAGRRGADAPELLLSPPDAACSASSSSSSAIGGDAACSRTCPRQADSCVVTPKTLVPASARFLLGRMWRHLQCGCFTPWGWARLGARCLLSAFSCSRVRSTGGWLREQGFLVG